MYYCDVCFLHLMIYHDDLFRSVHAYVTHSFDACVFIDRMHHYSFNHPPAGGH